MHGSLNNIFSDWQCPKQVTGFCFFVRVLKFVVTSDTQIYDVKHWKSFCFFLQKDVCRDCNGSVHGAEIITLQQRLPRGSNDEYVSVCDGNCCLRGAFFKLREKTSHLQCIYKTTHNPEQTMTKKCGMDWQFRHTCAQKLNTWKHCHKREHI